MLGHDPATLRSLLRRPPYRRLWTARTVSQWGDTFNVVALALLVFELTGSGIGVSAVVAAEIVPVLLLAPVAGVVVDRLPRVRVMIASDLVRAGLAGSLLLAQHHVGAVYGVAFGMAAASVFFNPAAASVLPSVVEDDELVAANSGIWTAAVLSQILLAPVAAAIVAAVGFGAAFAVNAVSFVASAVALRGLQVQGAAVPAARRRWLSSAREGVHHLVGDRLLRALAGAQLLAALSAGATSALLVVLAREHLAAGRRGFGVLLGAIGVGAATGPLLVHRVVRGRARQPWVVFGAFGLRGVVDLVMASFRSFGVAVGAVAVYGIGTSAGTITFNSFVQSTVPEGLRGRVFAAFDLLWQLGRLASLVAGGIVADALGIRAVYYAGGVLLLLAAASGLRTGQDWRRRTHRRRRRAMEMPKPTEADKEYFRSLIPDDERVEVKPMFGNLGGFVNGNMFMGLFGAQVGLKLDEGDRQALLQEDGAGPFGPAERPMGGYVTMPAAWRSKPAKAKPWVTKAMEHVAALPPKKSSAKKSSAKKR